MNYKNWKGYNIVHEPSEILIDTIADTLNQSERDNPRKPKNGMEDNL